MGTTEYRIVVVLDQLSGDKLFKHESDTHVWVCNSTKNIEIVNGIRANKSNYGTKLSITTFNYDHNISEEDSFKSIMPVVDLHDGDYGHNPPWNILEVYGVPITESIKDYLKSYGVKNCVETNEKFIGYR